MTKPYAASCDQNKDVILDIIQPILLDKTSVLEIGSGTGQHAVHFAKNLPHLTWQCSDQEIYHHGIKQWLADASLDNTPPPLVLNVSSNNWPNMSFDAVFSANTLHIMSWDNVVAFFKKVANHINKNGSLIIYGPFNYNKQYTSESNASFDVWLKQRDHKSAIRDFEAVSELASNVGLLLKHDYEMPANNRTLHWKKG